MTQSVLHAEPPNCFPESGAIFVPVHRITSIYSYVANSKIAFQETIIFRESKVAAAYFEFLSVMPSCHCK